MLRNTRSKLIRTEHLVMTTYSNFLAFHIRFSVGKQTYKVAMSVVFYL